MVFQLLLTVSALALHAAALCSNLPKNIHMPNVTSLNDPFRMVNGHRVSTKAGFACRQAEVSQLLQRFELGVKPPKPSSLTTSFVNNTLTVNVVNDGISISFTAPITFPTTGQAPFPAIIGFGGVSIPRPAGVAIISFNNNDFALQNDQSSRGVGKFYTLFGTNHTAGAMMAWAWGISRLIDAIELTPETQINVKRIGLTGCSRNGKGALVAGAFDDRIALTIPQESGSGGTDCWRVSDSMLASGINTQTASEIVQENVWLSTSFNPFVDVIPTLPFDHHQLVGMVAPRGLLAIDNAGIDWLGPQSVFGCMSGARKIYQALGKSDNMGFVQADDHPHCSFPAEQQPALDAFVGKFLLDQSTDTSNVFKPATNLTFDEATWLPWSVPELH